MAYGNVLTNVGIANDSPAVDITSLGHSIGHILVFGYSIDRASDDGVTWPSGFVEIAIGSPQSMSFDGQTMRVATKKSNGSETGVLTATVANPGRWAAFIARYTGRHQTTWENTSSGTQSSTGTASPSTITAPTITPSMTGCDLLWVATLDVNTGSTPVYTAPTSPGTFTKRAEPSNGVFGTVGLADLENYSGGATGTVSGSATHAGNAGKAGILIALAPAGASPDPAISTCIYVMP